MSISTIDTQRGKTTLWDGKAKPFTKTVTLTKNDLEQLAEGKTQKEINILCQEALTLTKRPMFEETINHIASITTNTGVLLEILRIEDEVTPKTVDIILTKYPTMVAELYRWTNIDKKGRNQKLVEHAYWNQHIQPGDIPGMIKSFPALDSKILEQCSKQGNISWLFLILKTPNINIKHLLPELYNMCPVPELFLKNSHTPTQTVDQIFEDTVNQENRFYVDLLLQHENLSPKNWVTLYFEQGAPHNRKWAQNARFQEELNNTPPVILNTVKEYLNQYTTRNLNSQTLEYLLKTTVDYDTKTVKFSDDRNVRLPF